MKAQISSWCVTFFADEEVNSCCTLRQIYDAACRIRTELNIGVGSVSVLCSETPPSVTGTQYYVTLLRCDRKDAERVLSEAGLPIGQFAFEDVPLEDVGKSSSVGNRRHRLRDCY